MKKLFLPLVLTYLFLTTNFLAATDDIGPVIRAVNGKSNFAPLHAIVLSAYDDGILSDGSEALSKKINSWLAKHPDAFIIKMEYKTTGDTVHVNYSVMIVYRE